MNTVLKSLTIAGLLTVSASSQAALQSRAGGSMIYDTDLDITWLADANLFKTQVASNPDLISQIIAANGGVIRDTANPLDGNDGIYSLSHADFKPISGKMNWFGAMAWANSLSYGGFDDWRLPTTLPAASGYGKIGSEMGHLFYSELGGQSGHSISTENDDDSFDVFSNFQSAKYWSASEKAGKPQFAWDFDFANGLQDNHSKSNHFFALAVHAGDIAAVPVPGAVWLFASGLLAFFGLRRRNHRG